MRLVIGLLISSCLLYSKAWAVNVGIGFSSHTSGRQIPALNIGRENPSKFYWGFSTVGVQTTAYYDTSYNLVLLKMFPGGTLFGKPLKAGLGIGLAYGEKGVDPDPGNSTAEKEELLVDKDYNYGPAFKVAYYPAPRFYFAAEYTLGLGEGGFGLGFGDVGMWSIGVEY